jgi:hypothetical protein
MPFRAKCGTEIPAGAVFCPSCGVGPPCRGRERRTAYPGTSFLRDLSKINWVLLLLDVVLGLALEPGYTKKFSDRLLGTSVTR